VQLEGNAGPMNPRPTPLLPLAAEAVARDYGDLVLRVAHHFCATREEAQDAAQEAFISLIEALPTFRGGCALSTWVYRITLNACRARGRHRQLLRQREAPLEHDPPSAELPASARLELDERQQALRRAVAALPADYRAVVVLHYHQGLSYDDVAEVLGLPLGTVKVRLFRAKQLLRRRLGAISPEPPEEAPWS
jgi:RNA polymerase sigma-70 factor (ECF subfamily)